MALSVHIRKKLKDFVLSVRFESGDGCMGLLGSSGCGKSMTLKCIAGIETPDAGKIILDGRVLFDSEKKINLPPQKRRVGYLFQNYALFPNMTVKENVKAGLAGSGKSFVSQKEKEAYIYHLLEQFHIGELAETYPLRMSGGQQQRTALARIVASDPDILLLDEPFSALDSYLREQMMQEMMTFFKTYQKKVLMVSHDRDEIYQMCDQMAVMGIGKIEISGETTELFRNPQTLGAAKLTGCKNISSVEIRGPYTLYAVDWGIELHMSDKIPAGITHAGIRAHDLREGKIDDKNIMNCTLERISEAPFEMYLILKNSQNVEKIPVWWKIPKNMWEEMKEKVPDRINFPPEHIILLKNED